MIRKNGVGFIFQQTENSERKKGAEMIAEHNMREKKLLIFDLDGTLVDTYRAIQLALNRTRKEFVLAEVSLDKVRTSVGMGDKKFMQDFFPPQHAARALEIYRREHRDTILQQAELMPQARETLSYLKKSGYLLAIASNRPTEFTELILRHLRIKKYFNRVLCADKIESLKPAPEILLRVMESLNTNPAECVYVGDMDIDVETARNAGVTAIAVTTGSTSSERLTRLNPHAIINNLGRLREFL